MYPFIRKPLFSNGWCSVRWALFVICGFFLLLQKKLWYGDGSYMQLRVLQKEVLLEQERIEKLKFRNLTLEAEVQDLKYHMEALEERARVDLGMIRQGETFYQFSKNNKND